MFQTLKRLYSLGKLDNSSLQNAIKKGWITKEQALEINPNGNF